MARSQPQAARLLLLLSAAVLTCGVVPAIAQAPAVEDGAFEDIVITAQRRAQSSQDVPLAVTVLKGEALVERGITNIKGIETVTPSFEVEQTFGTGQPVFTLRGVGFDDYTANNAPTVGIYVDDVAYTVPVMTQGSLFDVSRVEVLRGPQGTLYGRNTTGGAVAFVSNRATDSFEAGASADYGRFNAWKLEGFLSGPLGDNVRGRAAFITEQGGGYQKNRRTGEKLGDANRFAARLSFEFGDEDEAMLRVNGHYYRDKSDGLGAYLLAPLVQGTARVPADSNRLLTDWGASPTFFAQTKVPVTSKPFRDNEGLGFSFYGVVNLGSAQLTSITAYEKLRRREFNDFDGTQINVAGTLFNSKPQTFSQELRFSSVGEQAINWVAGGYYGRENLTDDFRSDFDDSLRQFGFQTVSTAYTQKVRTLAVFGQVDAQVFDRVTVTAGLRYEDENRNLINFTTRIPDTSVVTVNSQNRKVGLSELSGKIGIAYEIGQKSKIFASVTRGVKSGGFTTYNSLAPEQIDPFNREVLLSYEIGFKSDFADGRLRTNIAAFYYDYKDQQIQGFFIAPTGPIGRIINVPKSRIYGGEAEITWQPFDSFVVQQSFGYKTGEFREFIDVDPGSAAGNIITINRAGQDLPFPKFSYSGSLSYTLPAGNFGLTGLVDYSYRDKDDRSRLGSTIYSVDSYWLVNARLTLKPAENDGWSLYAYGRNLLNQGYDITRNFFLPQVQIGYRGAPATYGLGASVRF